MLVLEKKLGKDAVGLALCLGESDSFLQAADQRQVIAVFAKVVHDVGNEEIDLGSWREDRAKIEGVWQDSDRYRGIAQVNGTSNDTGITCKPARPESVIKATGWACFTNS